MAANTRSLQLKDLESEDDQQSGGYDSEDREIRKGKSRVKRRRLDADEDSQSEDEEEISLQTESGSRTIDGDEDGRIGSASTTGEGSMNQSELPVKANPKQPPKLVVTTTIRAENLVTTNEAVRKSGVVYLSRIPPYMKPSKLRSLLTPYGTVNRLFLAPEDPAAHARRVRAGGNKKRSYTEGWVEFVRKHDAKHTCEMLNARPIGGKKGTYYRDDVWSLLYLRGFKWRDLIAQIAAEDAERVSRMRAEISKATRENKEFARNVEQSKVMQGMDKRRKDKKRTRRSAGGEDLVQDAEGPLAFNRQLPLTTFRQLAVARNKGSDLEQKPQEDVVEVLHKIF